MSVYACFEVIVPPVWLVGGIVCSDHHRSSTGLVSSHHVEVRHVEVRKERFLLPRKMHKVPCLFIRIILLDDLTVLQNGLDYVWRNSTTVNLLDCVSSIDDVIRVRHSGVGRSQTQPTFLS